MRSFAAGSLVIVLVADAVPVIKPSSPPRKRPATEKKKYVAASPHFEGASWAEMSGIGSTQRSTHGLNSPLPDQLTSPAVGKTKLNGLLHRSEGLEVRYAHAAQSNGGEDTKTKASHG